jgi:hypothetical protein
MENPKKEARKLFDDEILAWRTVKLHTSDIDYRNLYEYEIKIHIRKSKQKANDFVKHSKSGFERKYYEKVLIELDNIEKNLIRKYNMRESINKFKYNILDILDYIEEVLVDIIYKF